MCSAVLSTVQYSTALQNSLIFYYSINCSDLFTVTVAVAGTLVVAEPTESGGQVPGEKLHMTFDR